jgi:hypothetical protein
MKKEVITSLGQLQHLYEDLRGKCVSETKEQVTLPITNTLNRQKFLAFANHSVHIKKVSKSGSAQRTPLS